MSETKSEIKVKEKDVVVPGEVLAVGMDYLPSAGTYRLGDKILSSGLGLLRVDGKVLKIIPLSGKYLPKRGDTIIARVTEIVMSGWLLDTNSAYHAMLSMKDAGSMYIARGADLSQYFRVSDYVVTKIFNVTSQKLVDITMRAPGLRKLRGGRVIHVSPNKVPRIIGKNGSMISMIKDTTGCRIIVGQNGLVWIEGKPKDELMAVEAIQKIEKESHITGLTEKMKDYLEKATGRKVVDYGLQEKA